MSGQKIHARVGGRKKKKERERESDKIKEVK